MQMYMPRLNEYHGDWFSVHAAEYVYICSVFIFLQIIILLNNISQTTKQIEFETQDEFIVSLLADRVSSQANFSLVFHVGMRTFVLAESTGIYSKCQCVFTLIGSIL